MKHAKANISKIYPRKMPKLFPHERKIMIQIQAKKNKNPFELGDLTHIMNPFRHINLR